MILRLALDLPEDKPYVTLSRLLGRTTLQYLRVNDVDVKDIETIMDELTSNVVRHARSEAGRFQLTLDYHAEKIVVTVEDRGQGFSPEAVPEPGSLRADLDGGDRIGGYGLGLVQAMTDRLEFHAMGDRGTRVRAEKLLSYGSAADADRAKGLDEDDASIAIDRGEKAFQREPPD